MCCPSASLGYLSLLPSLHLINVDIDENDDNEVFWGALGGRVELPAAIIDEEEYEIWLYKYADVLLTYCVTCSICRISNIEGKLSVAPLEDVQITKKLLDTNSCFILDCETEVYVWQGKKVSPFEKRASTVLAKEILVRFDRYVNMFRV